MTQRRLQPTKYLPPVPGDILEALEDLGIEVVDVTESNTKSEAWALCPAHDSRSGQADKWSVNLDTGQHSCFKCGFSGSFIDLVKELTGYDYHRAEQWIKRHGGGIERVERILATPAHRGRQQRPEPQPFTEARLAIFSSVPAVQLGRRRVSPGSVEKYGVLWDSERKNWILPIRDPYSGKLWGYQEKGDGWFSNVPGGVQKSETLFGLDCFEGRTAILLESPLDDLRIYTAGYSGAVSSYGVQVSKRQLEILFDIAERVIFALDNDEAGIKKSLQLRDEYLGSGKMIDFLDYSHIPWAKDLGTEGVTDEDIGKSIQNAIPLIMYGL